MSACHVCAMYMHRFEWFTFKRNTRDSILLSQYEHTERRAQRLERTNGTRMLSCAGVDSYFAFESIRKGKTSTSVVSHTINGSMCVCVWWYWSFIHKIGILLIVSHWCNVRLLLLLLLYARIRRFFHFIFGQNQQPRHLSAHRHLHTKDETNFSPSTITRNSERFLSFHRERATIFIIIFVLKLCST